MLKKFLDYLLKEGAEFKNLEFKQQNDSIQIKALNNDKKFLIKLPKKILIPREAIEIDDEKHCFHKEFVNENKPILDEYLNLRFKKFDLNYWQEINEDISKLDDNLKSRLSNADLDIFFTHNYSHVLKDRFLFNDVLKINKKFYFIPLLGFLHKEHTQLSELKIDDENITITGMPDESGNIVVDLNEDVISKFTKMSIDENIRSVFSIRLRNIKVADKTYYIRRNMLEWQKNNILTSEENNIFIKYCVLTDKNFCIKNGLESELFNKILQINIKHINIVLDLLSASGENKGVITLKKLYYKQYENLRIFNEF